MSLMSLKWYIKDGSLEERHFKQIKELPEKRFIALVHWCLKECYWEIAQQLLEYRFGKTTITYAPDDILK